jgi:DNA/RNA-binding protein KIN17
MNATKWSTLSEFVKHLGREGIVHVDETERGFYISWIDNSPHTLAKREAVMKMERQNKDQEERDRLLIEEQIERGGSAVSLTAPIAVATEIKRDPTTEKISINLTKRPIGTASRRYLNLPLASSSNQTSSLLKLEENNFGLENSTFIPPPVKSEKRTFAVLDEILQSEEKNKKKKPIADNSTNADSKEKVESSDFPWIKPGIIVKVLNSSLAGGKYMNRKGKIIRCIGDYVAEIQLLDSSDVIRLDQVHLQTSVPPVGDLVLVLKGDDRGAMALVEKLHIDRFCADLLLLREDGSESQRHLIGIDYDWFSRFYA